ncbi:asparagine synthase-related protein [Marinirhabdus gelatinilytica]|uniref:asparagine synthase-related protein n=1 Tax=Marinirhabdus gelatinilytica TaxID=1703343 RepID=UPI000E0FB072|nr:asparagine synthase-related protein [Marinirhabdus gelatinilytica]
MPTIKTPIIPTKPSYVKVRAPHEFHWEAICVFVATGFFLDTDTYFKDLMVLPPASINEIDEEGFFVKSTPWFHWHKTSRALAFEDALEEFTQLFETIIDEQVGDKKVILPLSGGLDSRTQATALHHLGKDVNAYSYDFKGGYPETAIGKQIAKTCDLTFTEHHIEKGYLWDCIEQLAAINQCYSEFTHPRQMAIFDEYEKMGDIFSLGHWGDVLFDTPTSKQLTEAEELEYLLKKIIKKGGMELANALWEQWNLPDTFEAYLRQRVSKLLQKIDIQDTGAKIRAFKSLYWAPRWTNTNLSVFEEQHPITLPYFDDRMCQFICTVPEKHLEDRMLQIAYIKKRNPKLAKITWEQHKPYNLYTFQQNTSPKNIPYRAVQKLKRETKKALGKPYVQRNWELQFVGMENDEKLQQYLFSENMHPFISKPLLARFYNNFKNIDPVHYSHPLSMLLTLSLKMKLLK